MRNAKEVLEKTFSFLEKDFTKEIFSRYSEINLIYSNDVVKISIGYDEGILLNRNGYVWIGIEKKGTNKTIMECCELFGRSQLDEFRSQIMGKKVEEQIELYRKFISQNLMKLLQ